MTWPTTHQEVDTHDLSSPLYNVFYAYVQQVRGPNSQRSFEPFNPDDWPKFDDRLEMKEGVIFSLVRMTRGPNSARGFEPYSEPTGGGGGDGGGGGGDGGGSTSPTVTGQIFPRGY